MTLNNIATTTIETIPLGNPQGLVNTVTVEDAEEQAISLTAWYQEYDQISSGKFSGHFTEIWLGGVQFFIENNNRALRQSCKVWPNSIWFGIPSITDTGGYIDDDPFKSYSILVRSGGQEFELLTADNHEILGLVVDISVLKQYLNVCECSELLDLLLNTSVWQVPCAIMGPLWKKFAHVLLQAQDLSTNTPLHLSDSSCQLMLDELLMHLIDILQQARVQKRPKASNIRHRRLISSVRDYVIAKKENIITIKDLCDEFYVSRRTLQNCFQKTMNVCPVTYLKAIRLNAVRRNLKFADKSITIQDIAADYGFWHMSQFAADYQRLFGERPSETRLIKKVII